MLNILGSIIYLMTALLCMRATRAGSRLIEKRFWLGTALFFCFLIAVRLFALEDLFRNSLRAELQSEGIYAMRRDLQAGLAVIAILVAAGIAVFASRITGKISGLQQGVQMRVTGVAIRWALLGISVMLGVMMLRLISFHATDALLYRGPIRLNWILDIGATALTGWAAIRYANALRNSDSGQSSRFR